LKSVIPVQLQVLPTTHCELTVPALAVEVLSVVPGVPVFMLTSKSTGSDDQVCENVAAGYSRRRRIKTA